MNVPYIVYCHRGVAEKVGLTTQQYEDGLAGKVPEGLTESEEMAYKIARALTELNSRLGDEVWEEAIAKLGKSELVGVTHIVAAYRWVALLAQVNGDDHRWA